jgi:acetyl esterase/lipase
MLARVLICLALLTCSLNQLAAEPKTELLWPNGAPEAKGTDPKDKPTLIIWSPEKEKNCGAAIVVCPGGGYGGLAMDHEGKQIGEWLTSHGITALICDYRHRGKGYGHPAPLQDVQRAIRTARSRAKDLGFEPNKIGVLGFSAGGHLASTAVTHFDAGDEKAEDPIARVSCRPDFGVLCYAVIAFDQPFTHKGSQKNLLGEGAAPELVASLSNEKQVSKETPPTFLWHTYEDTGVPPENSIVFYQAMLKHKVPGELHVYEKGRHGVGLGKSIPGTGDWSDACIRWLKGREIVK